MLQYTFVLYYVTSVIVYFNNNLLLYAVETVFSLKSIDFCYLK